MTPIPTLSARLATITREFANTPSLLTAKINRQLNGMAGYKDLTPEARKDLENSLSYTARLWCETLLTGEGLSQDTRRTLKEIGCRRVHQGVPLQSLMRGFSLGVREIWSGYLELARDDDALSKELLLQISGYMFDFFDDIAEEVVQAYLEEQIQKVRWREHLHQRLYHFLLHSPQDTEGFEDTLSALGLDASTPRVALALELPLRPVQPLQREDEFDRLTLQVARHLKIPVKELIRVWYRDRLVIWLPGIKGETLTQCDQRMSDSAGSLPALLPSLRGIGIGLLNQGIAGWIGTAEEAIKAIDLFPFDGAEARVRRYSSVLIEDSVRSHDNTLRYLMSLIEQLSHEPDLLLTLEAFFSSGRHRAQTAKTLGIHPNTLNYRTGRIENLLGADLNDINWVSRLDTALKLRRHSISKGQES